MLKTIARFFGETCFDWLDMYAEYEKALNQSDSLIEKATRELAYWDYKDNHTPEQQTRVICAIMNLHDNNARLEGYSALLLKDQS